MDAMAWPGHRGLGSVLIGSETQKRLPPSRTTVPMRHQAAWAA
jgi:hypothetical protein